MVRQIIFASVVVLLPAGAFAQGRGAMAPMAAHGFAVAPRAVSAPHVAVPSAAVGTHVVRTGVPHRNTVPVGRTTRRIGVRNGFNNGFNRRGACANTAPGLGFDEAHQIAVCGPNAGFRGNGFGYGGGYYFPFYEGGFDMPGTAADDTYAADNSQDVTDTDVREMPRRYRAYQAAPAPAPVVSTDEPAYENNDQYVFVRRDGTLFFAVAYSWEKGTLRYITSQGLRQTVTKDALDLDATRQFNEQRGLSFQLPVLG
jgi:hypothetical protein